MRRTWQLLAGGRPGCNAGIRAEQTAKWNFVSLAEYCTADRHRDRHGSQPRMAHSCPGMVCRVRSAGRSAIASVVAYRNVLYVDYIDMPGTMTAALTSRIDAAEYKARILALAAIYWSLGIRSRSGETVNDLLRKKSAWAVLSFRLVAPEDAAFAGGGRSLQGSLEGSAPLCHQISIVGARRLRTLPTSRLCLWTCSRKSRRSPTAGSSFLNRGGTWHLDNLDTDVIVAGGGPAGAATAITCVQRGLRVHLFERAVSRCTVRARHYIPESSLCCASSAWNDRFQATVGARHSRHLALLGLAGGSSSPTAPTKTGAWHGFQVSRTAFDQLLLNHASEQGWRCVSPARSIAVQLQRENMVRVLTDAGPLSARIIVDATGRASWLSRRLGIARSARSPQADREIRLCRRVLFRAL